MKKIFLTVCAACAFGFATAQNIIQMTPAIVEANSDLDDAENVLVFSWEGAGDCYSFQFNLYVPDGLDVGDDETIFFEELDGIPVSKKKPVHTIDVAEKPSDMPGYRKYTFLGYDTKNTKFVGNDLFQLYVGSTEPGIYPVILEHVLVGGAVNTTTDFVTSYVKVGDASAASFAPKGVLSSAVNEALATETAISSLDLSEVTAINGDFTYTVGRAVTAPTSATADVKVEASCPAGGYASLCSPVELPNVKCYKFSSVNGNVVTFTETTGVPANEPVIIDAAVSETVSGADLATVTNTTASVGSFYVAPDGTELRRAANTPKVPALRGVWNAGAGSNLRIAFETPTGIKMIGTADEVFGNSYDLQGRQVENAKNGVYVVNGKKQFVK